MSGTFTSIVAPMAPPACCSSDCPWIGPLGIEPVLADRLVDDLRLDVPVVGERLQRGDDDVMTVHLEELAQLDAIVAAPEAVGTERDVAARNMAAHLVGIVAHVVGRRHHGSGVAFERRFEIALATWLTRVQQIPAL